jgi:hypothetical protein
LLNNKFGYDVPGYMGGGIASDDACGHATKAVEVNPFLDGYEYSDAYQDYLNDLINGQDEIMLKIL